MGNSSTFATLSLTLSSIPPLLLLGLSQNFGTSFTPTLGFYYLYPGTLVHWYTGTLAIVYPGYILMSHVPCTPPLLLLGLSQNFGTSFTPTFGFYYVYPGTLVHWYIGNCVPWVHCFWSIGTSLPWYIVMYHVPMYSSTFATWT